MAVVARLKKSGVLLTTGDLDERTPPVTSGLVASFPLDATRIESVDYTGLELKYAFGAGVIPNVPDAAAGQYYVNSTWASNPFVAGDANMTVSVVSNMLHLVAAANTNATASPVAFHSSEYFRMRIRSSVDATVYIRAHVSGNVYTVVGSAVVKANVWTIIDGYSSSVTGNSVWIHVNTAGTYDVSDFYIGTGAYTSSISDLSGNNRNTLTIQGVIPV